MGVVECSERSKRELVGAMECSARIGEDWRGLQCASYWSPANSIEHFLLAGSFCVPVYVRSCVCASGCYLWFCVCWDLVCDGERCCYGCGARPAVGGARQELVADSRAIIYYNSCPGPQ